MLCSKMVRGISIAGGVASSSCAQQINLSTNQVRSVIAQVFVDQAKANIGLFIDHPYAIPSQIQLSTGQATIQNSLTSGISPAMIVSPDVV